MREENICMLLNRIGLTANRVGYYYISEAVKLVIDDPEKLLLVSKWLYPEVAKHYGTTWKAVERDIRYEIKQLQIAEWEAACRLLNIPSNTKLTPGRFIALLAAYFAAEP